MLLLRIEQRSRFRRGQQLLKGPLRLSPVLLCGGTSCVSRIGRRCILWRISDPFVKSALLVGESVGGKDYF